MAEKTRNPFDQFDGPGPAQVNPFDQFDGASRTLTGTLGDIGVTALKGAVGLPRAVVGLADIPTGGRVGKALEGAGVRFKDAQETLDDLYSPAQQAANRKVKEADGFVGTAQAMLENPSTIAVGLGESLPQMLGGAGVARGLLSAAPKLGAVAAGALGEGVMGAGSSASDIREQTANGLLTGKQAAVAGASGAVTAALGAAGGKLAQRLGVGDVDTMLAGGTAKTASQASARSMPRQMVEGALTEGVLEEMPQSMSEQALQNYALDRPVEQGVGSAAAQGLITGMAMGGIGGGVGAMSNRPQEAQASAAEPEPEPGAATGAQEPGVVQEPDVLPEVSLPLVTAGPDGAATTTDVQSSGDIVDVTPAEPAPAPVDPVRAAVEDAAGRGGALSSAALTAMDAGAVAVSSEPVQDAPAARELTLEEADAADQAAYQQFFQSLDAEPAVLRYLDPDTSIPDFDAASNASDEDFLRALGASDQEIQDALAPTSQPAVAPGSAARDVGPQADDAARPSEAATGGNTAQGQVQGVTAASQPPRNLREGLERARAARQAARAPAAPMPQAGEPALQTAPRAADMPVPTISEQAQPPIQPFETTTNGAPNGPQADQAQQAGPQPAQAAAAPAAGLTDAAAPQNLGAQAAPASGAPAATAAGRAGRLADAGARWTRMPAAERQALTGRAEGLNALQRKRVHTAAWGDLNADIRRKLADAMGEGGEVRQFAPETGTLGIPRAEMPQVPTQSHGALVRHLNAQGIGHETTEVDAAELKPTQAEYSPAKVEEARERKGDRAVIVSSDGHIIDGHHQAMAAAQDGEPVRAIVLDAPVEQALQAVRNSPSAANKSTPEQEKKASVTSEGRTGVSAGADSAPPADQGTEAKSSVPPTPATPQSAPLTDVQPENGPPAMFSRSPGTRATYEARIDALFAGDRAKQGTRVLDASDVMGLLGYPRAPLILNESHLREGMGSHPEMTAAVWKKVPGWIENPAAVYSDPRGTGRLIVVAPEAVAGYPVMMVIEPKPIPALRGAGEPFQLLVTAYAKTTGGLPAAGFLASNGHLKYVHTQNAPGIWQSAGVQFPRQSALFQGRNRILTEKHLAGYRRANPAFSFADAGAGEAADTRTAARQASDARLVATQQLVDGIRERWKRSPEIIVARNMQDPQVQQLVRDYDAQLKSQGSNGQARGFIHQGKVYLLSDELNGPAQIAEVLFHEVLGHWGLRGVFGERLTPILQQIGTMRRAAVVAKAREYGLVNAEALADQGVDLDNASDRQVWAAMSPRNRLSAAEEVLAEMAQATPEVGFVRRAIAAIRTWLRENVPGFGRIALTDDEIIRSYLLPARGYVTRSDETPEQSLQRAMLAFSRGPGDGNAGDAVAAGDAQFRETERAYGGRDAYERAKAAGRTKLAYGQWVQVRTPNFKRWFGDWQALAAQQRLDAMEAVPVRVPQEWRGLDHAELRQRMAAELDRMVRARVEIEHPEIGRIRVGRAGAKKTEGSARDPAKSLVAADLEALIPQAIYARSEPSRGGDGPDVDGYSTLLARVDVDGVPLVAAFTVRHQSDGQWYYNAVTLHDANEKARDSYGRPDQQAAGSSAAPIAGLREFSRRPLQRVNPDSVSQVVDPQTGEPLVVYHGTPGESFEAFDKSRIGSNVVLPASAPRGFYFAKDRQLAQKYGPNVIEAFVAGPVLLNNSRIVVVENPSQIKSATSNNGNFDPADERINFSRQAGGKVAAATEGTASVPGDPREGFDSLGPTQTAPTPTRDGLGASTSSIVRASDDQDNLPAISLSGATDQTRTEAFKRWYGDWQNAGDVPEQVEPNRGGAQASRNGGGAPLDGLQRPQGVDQNAPRADGARRFTFSGASGPTGADGAPVRLYHGTKDDIAAFDLAHPRRKDKGWLGTGVYLTSNQDDANQYARAKRGDAGPNLMPLYANVRNPFEASQADKARLKRANEQDIAAFTNDLKAKGHDGVVLWDEAGDMELVVFDPANVKSAIGNNGNFDPSDPDIRFSRAASPSQPAAWDAPTPTGFDDVIYKLQDKNIDLKRVVESITKSVGQVSDSINAYLKEELFHKRAAKRVADFGARELKPLMNQMRLASLSMEDVEEYLHARHAKEANAVIAQRNPGNAGLQDGGSGMTNAAADNYFAKLDPAQRRKLESVAAKVDAIIADTRKLYVDYGLEDQAVVDGWANMYQHYIPLMREDKDGGMGTGQGFSVKGRETKGRTGSTRKVVDILANIASQRERLIVRGEKNRVTQALVGLAQANPNTEFWEVRSQAPSERVFDPKSGVVVERPDPLFKSRDNVVVAKVKDAKGNVTEQMVVFNEDNPRAVRMAAAMKNLDAGNLEGLLGVSAKITRYFAAINTQYNPIFGVVNLVRDVQGAMVNLAATPLAGQQGKIAKDTVSALLGIYGDIRKTRKGGQATSQWSQLWEQMQDDGGTTGYRELFTTSADRANNLKSILNPESWMENKWGKFFTANGKLRVPMSIAQKGATEIFGWLSDYNEAMENGVRLAAYKAALDKGLSREQAASIAKNLTVNFNRKGQVGQQAGAVYAFFNAAMQGTARIGQTLFDMDGGDISTLRLSKTGKAVVYGGITLGAIQALALAAAGFDAEDPPEFVRERSLIIPTGGKTYMTIPMPLGLHVIPGIGRHAVEFALSGFDKPAQRAVSVVGMFADAFNPIGNAGLSMQTIAPTALDPLVALTENKDWTGKPIARVSSNKALPGHTQWKDTATWFSKVVAEAINWVSGGNEYVAGALSPTPDQIDYLLAQLGGGVAREAAKIQQTISSTLSGEELPTHKIPLVGRFVGSAASQASQASAFYANLNRLNELETEIKGLRKDGRFDEAAKLARENPESMMIAMANRAERDVQRLRREKRELIANDASREQVRAKEEQITAVMTRLNEAAKRRKALATQ